MTVEERLRATTEAVTAAMRPVRPLDLPLDPSDARAAAKPGRARSPRRWPGWLVPVAAAVAVIAVAATLVAVRNLSAAGPGPRVTPAATSTSNAALPGGAPRYYVALSYIGTSKGGAPVRNAFLADAGTGKRLATLNPPSNAVFADTAASADDKTFVLLAVIGNDLGPSGSTRAKAVPPTYVWYVLRLTPGNARQARLTPVPIFTDTPVAGLAVSPDGRTLAVLSQATSDVAGKVTPSGPLTLRTYSLTTARVLRTWTDPAPSSSVAASGDLSWLGDGRTLAFAYPLLAKHQDIRTLDTTSPGTNLVADSRPVFPVPTGAACYSALLTSDGKAVICGTWSANGRCSKELALTAYSVATGKLERVLYRYEGDCTFGTVQVEWAKSATLAIGFIEISKPVTPPPPVTNMVGVVTPGKFTALPVTLVGGAYGPGSIAF